MITIPFLLSSKERIILSATHASAGQHECLDFIPGNALLGAFASLEYKINKSTSPDTNFHLFHSGAVSFGDAYPVTNSGFPCIRVPLSFHTIKTQAGHNSAPPNKEAIISEKTYNLAASSRNNNGEQLIQMRDEWMAPDGAIMSVASGHLVKTARDSTRRGTPVDGQLFGYSYIEAGQSFCGCIYVDSAYTALADKLKNWIENTPSIFIGRSHNAEFGCCELLSLDQDPYTFDNQDIEAPSPLPDEIHLLALSDCWFTNGLPTAGADYHPLLEHYSLTPNRTFARFRSYSPWNSFRGFPDPQREVICKGSVITLNRKNNSSPQSHTLTDLRKALQSDGVGSAQSEGLGRILVNPTLLAHQYPTFIDKPASILPPSKEPTPQRPDSPYLSQIERRSTRAWIGKEADGLAKQLIEDWKMFRPQPPKNQWSHLRNFARNAPSPEAFNKQLKSFANSGAAKQKWIGIQRGCGTKTLIESILDAWDMFLKSHRKNSDFRSQVKGGKELVFLKAVAEASRRLRDIK